MMIEVQKPPFCQTDVVCSTVLENVIFNEDCLETLKRIPTGSIDLMLTDIPYGTTQNEWDNLPNLNEMWKEWDRVMSEKGCWVFTCSQPATSELVLSNKKYFKYSLVWDKVLSTGHLNANIMPLRRHEDILVFSRGKTIYNPQKIKRDVVRIDKGSQKQVGGDGKSCYGKFTYDDKYLEFREPTSIIQFSNADKTNLIHPTQKPIDIFRYLIKTYSNENDLVFDGYMGSGTTAIACIEENRRFLGSELNKEYYDKAIKRIKIKQSQPSLFAGR
jgi:site-specific DNA-methyltransferase (adenine-specific)